MSGAKKGLPLSKTKNKQTAADKPTGSDNQTPSTETGGEVAQKPTAETAKAQTATGGGETATADDALAAAQKEAQENRELLMRKAAELENLRKRAIRDMENAVNNALEQMAMAMCDVRDCVAAAINDDNKNADNNNLREGVALILQKIESALQANRILPVNPDRGLTFDPELHQSVVAEENADLPENAIIGVLQTGYTINNRLLRPARVIISRAPAQTNENQAENKTGNEQN